MLSESIYKKFHTFDKTWKFYLSILNFVLTEYRGQNWDLHL